ncbi:MAG: CPBP family intramembrane glutamic endopeptidase [Pseudomonadota bacterium]|nr:CPBP family intramembrane glutamic endopeptidase [Pseudomonadota bacterium]
MTRQLPLESLPNRIWLSLLPISMLCLSFYFYNQENIFPTINTPITVNQQTATKMALDANNVLKLKLNPKEVRTTSAFISRSEIQNYISLEAGGNEKLNQLIKSGDLISSFWSVKLFIPKEIQQNTFQFTPEGKFYGYQVGIPEEKSLPNISKEKAQLKMHKFLKHHPLANTNFSEFTEKDYVLKKQDNGRQDHTFIYENKSQTIGEAVPEIICTISGNRITKLQTYYKLPENFLKNFQAMNSYNNFLGSIGSMIIIIGYFGAAVCTIAYGWKKGLLNWTGASSLALFITATSLLSQINILPIIWYMAYDPSRNESQFLWEVLIPSLTNSVTQFIYLSVTFLAAEFLTRQAFPHHPQLFSWLSPRQAGSITSLKQIALGYTMMFIDLGYIALFYLTALQLPGVWSPSFNLIDPNFMAYYMPFFTPFANSLHAGIWEEFLFRAIPIALAVIVSKKYFKKPAPFIIIALILQAVIFGLAHANYPQQPSYIRIIELSIPFFFWGLAYIYCGLLPCIIAHYTYDMFVMSESLFFIQTPGIWLQQLLAAICISLPLLLVVIQKLSYSSIFSWHLLPNSARNDAWKPEQSHKSAKKHEQQTSQHLSRPSILILAATAILSFGVFAWYTQEVTFATTKLTISKSEALKIGRKEAAKFIDLDKPWQETITTQTTGFKDAPYYIETVLGKEKTYKLLESRQIGTKEEPKFLDRFLPQTVWHIRYALYEGDQDTRSEELHLYIRCTNMPITFDHIISENIPGTNLSKQEAIQLAQESLQNYTLRNANETPWSTLNVSSTTNPSNRLDWAITLGPEKAAYDGLQPRWYVTVQGDQVSSVDGNLFIPEKWLENHKEKKGVVAIIQQVISLGVILGYIVLLYQTIQAYAEDHINLRNIVKLLLGLAFIRIVASLNNQASIYQLLSPASPIANQLGTYWISVSISIFIASLSQSLYTNYLLTSQRNVLRNVVPFYSTIYGFLLSMIFFSTELITNLYTSNPYYYPYTASLDATYPLLNQLIYTFVGISFSASVVISLCAWMQKSQDWITSHTFTLFAITCYFLSSISYPGSNGYIIQSLLFAPVAYLSYVFVIRYDLSTIVAIVAGNTILHSVVNSLSQPYPGSWIDTLVIILVSIIISYSMISLIQVHQKSKMLENE